MKGLKNRVERVVRRTHLPVTQGDWEELANYYLTCLQDEGRDPETYREESDNLIDRLRTIDPVLEAAKYKATVEEFASNDQLAFLAHMYFITKANADERIKIIWRERDYIEGVLRRVREVREYMKARSL